jgi:hypothetical protein
MDNAKLPRDALALPGSPCSNSRRLGGTWPGVLKTDGFATAHQATLIASDIRQPAALLLEKETGRRIGMIQHISAVTFAIRDMARSSIGNLDLSCSTAVAMQSASRRSLGEAVNKSRIRAKVVGRFSGR